MGKNLLSYVTKSSKEHLKIINYVLLFNLWVSGNLWISCNLWVSCTVGVVREVNARVLGKVP